MPRKYQRSLVPYFKKYQLTSLYSDKNASSKKVIEKLGSKTVSLLEGEEAEERELDLNRRLQLMETVQECFDNQ